ncbi:hypothetical protein [Citrobacter portucalensis]|uniref:hypothetical protein n=1 Tax=Citrobacter portucalensis TaxID=1639133 RepID=UPI003B260042
MALLYNVNSFAAPPINVWLRCADGTHATLKDGMFTGEGFLKLPFEHIENETDQQITLVFANDKIEAKVLIQYTGAKFFLKNTDGSLVPCAATKIP